MNTPTRPLTPPGKFEFGLTAAQEARAAQLHRESIVFGENALRVFEQVCG